jgi:hypothetical protein
MTCVGGRHPQARPAPHGRWGGRVGHAEHPGRSTPRGVRSGAREIQPLSRMRLGRSPSQWRLSASASPAASGGAGRFGHTVQHSASRRSRIQVVDPDESLRRLHRSCLSACGGRPDPAPARVRKERKKAPAGGLPPPTRAAGAIQCWASSRAQPALRWHRTQRRRSTT